MSNPFEEPIIPETAQEKIDAIPFDPESGESLVQNLTLQIFERGADDLVEAFKNVTGTIATEEQLVKVRDFLNTRIDSPEAERWKRGRRNFGAVNNDEAPYLGWEGVRFFMGRSKLHFGFNDGWAVVTVP